MAGTVALVVAAGRGHRLGGALPKQYLHAAGQPLLRHAVAAFLRHPAIDDARVVIHADDRPLYDAAMAGLDPLAPVSGGATRQASVLAGLESLAADQPERVLIHDAARAAIDAATISRVIAALDDAPGAFPALAVNDSLKRVVDGRVTAVDRTGLWRAQTPQGFRFDAILAAHRALAGGALGDDVAVAEAAGLAVTVVAGGADNLKVTTPDDLERVARRLDHRLIGRAGLGFDVHAFGPGDRIMLCGVAIPHERGLVGHSDADVALHALVDAVLGALGAGDIGDHFPPDEPRWHGAPSARFATHARDLVAKAGGRVDHLDVTIACERPKIAPHRAAMAARVAELFGVAPGHASVKATTTERLGFLGRGEGIAALAVASLSLPG